MTRFHHHTLIEYLYLREAMAKLAPEQQAQIKQQAADVLRRTAAADRAGESLRVMCPLNHDGRCVLYAQRPMICRLHGIPHELRRPDGQIMTGPGCDDFHARCDSSDRNRLDRTPLYMAMAELEQELRRDLGDARKIKMTVAEMIHLKPKRSDH